MLRKLVTWGYNSGVELVSLPEFQALTAKERLFASTAVECPELAPQKLATLLRVNKFEAYKFFKSDKWEALKPLLVQQQIDLGSFGGKDYVPHPKQKVIHDSRSRFKVVAAGRRGGKTVLAVNELIDHAKRHPQLKDGPIARSWYVCNTYRQAEMVAWHTILRYIPKNWIKCIKGAPSLYIELVNGHIIELKGAEDPNNLRGVALYFVVMDEYGLMREEAWTEVIRPMLVDTRGEALFIGTPGPDGSPHFHELWKLGQGVDPAFESWLFFSTDNPKLPKEEIDEARRNSPADIFKREYEADFDCTAGLIYDNFRHSVHVIPNYVPNPRDFIVGSIDPGLNNPTAALLCAWDQQGVGRIFWEYYEEDKIASENAQKIRYHTRQYKISYWVIDSASKDRSQTGGETVYQKYQEWLRPLLPAVNNPGTVWSGIDEVKKCLHSDPKSGKPRLYVTALCHNWLWEIGRYIRYKRKWHSDQNEAEKPRKLNDHLMDATRNMVYSKPWIRPAIRIYAPERSGYPI